MEQSEHITGALQENLLTLLVFDKDSAPIIANSIEVGLFESDLYKDIAEQAINFFNQFKEPPGEHISDLLESKLQDKENPRLANLYQRILINLFEAQGSINTTYVLSQLNRFIRQQRMKGGVIEAIHHIKQGELDEAENVLTKSLKSTLDVFNPGIAWGSDLTKTLGFYDNLVEPYKTGIAPLDMMGIGPAPGELFTVLAPAGRGKTWMMVHLGKFAAMQRLKVLHISLEMSEEKMSRRYVQSFFSLGKRQKEAKYFEFKTDELGRFMNLSLQHIERASLYDHGVEQEVLSKLKKIQNRIKLIVKHFPTGSLSINGLEAYLDALERFNNFIPDLLLVDYADLLKINNPQALRLEIGGLYKELRRIAGERNIACVTASQSNRASEDAKVITLKHLGEDYSKAATSDNVIAYCQTTAEQKLGLARLFVAKARDEEKEMTILISQCYRLGQFIMNALPMSGGKYWEEIESLTEASTEETTEKEETPKKRVPTRIRPRS